MYSISSNLIRKFSSSIYVFICRYDRVILWFLGFALLVTGTTQLSAATGVNCSGPDGSCSTPGFSEELIRGAVGNLFMLIEGAFGALIMVVSGIGAIVAAAMGAYRAALGMLVVAIGSFILRSLVSLFFGTDYAPVQVD